MGIIKGLSLKWKASDTTGKVGMVLDILCKIGSGGIGIALGNQFSEGRGKIGKVCTRITTTGLGIAIGDIASQKMQETYAPVIGKLIDGIKKKLSDNPEKEEKVNE